MGLVVELTKSSKRTPFFFHQDLYDCQCKSPLCTTTLVDTDLLRAAKELYDLSGGFEITSGFRCYAHNKEVGGKLGSYHTIGKAWDIKSTLGLKPLQMCHLAQKVMAFYEGGIGLYEDFIHLDVRGYPARWTIPALNQRV